MNPAELELFLYRHTESENWHLQHPGQLSCLYDKLKQEKFRGEMGYCFDFVNTLKKDMIGMIKETCITSKGRPVKPKTLGQKKYIEAIRKNTVTLGVGPAGTGKTYLARHR